LNERTIWIVRIIGIAVILVLLFLLSSLYTRLVRLNREQQRPKAGSGATLLPPADVAARQGAHA
jgi:hypothetical protein